jgi:hypothetical protein
MNEESPNKDWIDPESDDPTYRRSINPNWRATRPRSNRRPKGSGKSWSKLSEAQRERIRRLHAAGKGEPISREVRQAQLARGERRPKRSPGSIRSLANLYRVSPGTIRRAIREGRKAAGCEPRPVVGPDLAQKKQRERALAVRCVRELLGAGAIYEAKVLMQQFAIQSHEVE